MGPVLIADTKPAASRTAEVHLMLSGSADESSRRRIDFPRPVRIVGVKTTVSVSGVPAVGRRRPTAEDLLLKLSGSDVPLTSTDEGSVFDEFVSASALDISARFMNLELKGSPNVTVQARWKNEDNSTPIFEDSIIAVAFLYDFTGEG